MPDYRNKKESSCARPHRDYYHFNELKAIPILSVASALGIQIRNTRGTDHWCSVRREDKTPSCVLHADTNTYHDFGTGRGGDGIDLVGYTLNMDLKASQEWLGKQFNLTPKNRPYSNRERYEMSPWEYGYIGLASDLATKNFRFDINKLSIEAISRISARYAMTMNELRQKHPGTYAKVLYQKAIPYVTALRDEYFMSLWSLNQLLLDIGNPETFLSECQRGVFDDMIQELERAERSLHKAARGTRLKLDPLVQYDPVRDLESVISGEVEPSLGKLAQNELEQRAADAGTEILHVEMDYNRYISSICLTDFDHTATLRAGTVTVGYLKTDQQLFQQSLNPSRQTIEEKIARAQQSLSQFQSEAPAEQIQSQHHPEKNT